MKRLLQILEWLALGWAYFILFKYLQRYPLNSNLLFSILPTQIFFPTFSILLFYLKGLLLFIGICLGSFSYGSFVLNKFKVSWSSVLEKGIFSTLIGHGLTSLAILLLASLHILSKPALFVLWLLGIIHFLFLLKNNEFRNSLTLTLKESVSFLFGNENLLWVRLFVWIFLGLSFMMALVPELFYDALVYHLGAPNLYLQEGGIVHIPGVLSKVPMIWQILYLYGIGLQDEIIPKLIHWSNGLFLVLAMGTFSKRFQIQSPGLLPGLLFLSVPMVQMNLWTSGTDIGGALFAYLALYALCTRCDVIPAICHSGITCLPMSIGRSRNLVQPTLTDPLSWTILCSIFCAFSFSSKYQGGVTALMVFIVLVCFLIAYNRKNLLQEASLFILVFGIFISPWLLKNLWDTGNPLFPFLSNIFNKIGLQKYNLDPEQWVTFINENRRFISSGIKEWWSLPWKLAFKDSNQSSLSFTGPIFLATLSFPLLLAGEWKKKWLQALFLFTVLFFGFSFNSTHLTRYHLQGYPALAALFGAPLCYAWRQKRIHFRLLLTIPLLILLLENLQVVNFVIQNSYRPWDVLAGRESREEYRSYSHPGQNPYPANVMFHWMEKNLPKRSRTLFLGDSKPFNLQLPYLYSDVHGQNPIIGWSESSKTAEELQGKLKSAGITHFLVNLEEAHRTYSYKMLKWDKVSLQTFDDFWQKYVVEFHREIIPEKYAPRGGLILLYAIQSEPRGESANQLFNPLVLLENLSEQQRKH